MATPADPPRQLGPLSGLVRRAMLRTSAGPLRPLWRLAYRAVAWGVSAYLRAGDRTASVYVMGSLGSVDVVYGDSDVDLAVVVPAAEGRPGAAREALVHRWDELRRRVPQLRSLVFVAVYEDHDLRSATASSPCLPSGLFGPGPFVDPANVASRPMLEPPARSWHRLAGPRLLPSAPRLDARFRGRSAWLELQHWWRYAFGVSVAPGPRAPHLCVKLVSEPARVWLWLVHGERVPSRRQALRRGIEALPDERETFERALELHSALPRSPDPPLAQTFEALLRLTGRIASRIADEVEAEGFEDVRFSGMEDELVLAPGAGDPLRALLGSELRLLPLVDWRALAWPAAPDDALAEVPGGPADPATLRAATIAGRGAPYPVLRHDGLLVLPAQPHVRTLMRAVQSPLTDPTSFAILDGADVARFSRAPGWSIRETALRAVAEHRAWLRAGGGTGTASADALGLLFGAARAGLLLESLESAEPVLALTVSAVASSLTERGRTPAATSAHEAYRECRDGGSAPPAPVIADLRRCVLALPAYLRAQA
jgi:hypothetical protein